MISSEDPPLSQTGRKKGYIEIMLELWNEKGYERLGLTGQNLKDQASRLQEKRDCSINTAFSQDTEEKDEDNEGEYAISQPRPRQNFAFPRGFGG